MGWAKVESPGHRPDDDPDLRGRHRYAFAHVDVGRQRRRDRRCSHGRGEREVRRPLRVL